MEVKNDNQVRIVHTDSNKYILIFNDQRVHVIVTSNPAVVEEWVSTTLEMNEPHFQNRLFLVVGLGVTVSNSSGKITTLQLCQRYRCLIFQLVHATKSPDSLNDFFSNPRVIFVVVDNSTYIQRKLSEPPHRLTVDPIMDLHLQIPKNKLDNKLEESLETLAMTMTMTENDWENKSLSEEQVKNASLYAFLIFLTAKDVKVWEYMPGGVQGSFD